MHNGIDIPAPERNKTCVYYGWRNSCLPVGEVLEDIQ